MKQSLALLIIVLLSGCSTATTSTPLPTQSALASNPGASAPESSAGADASTHIVVEVAGNASYRRNGWAQSQQLRFGTALHTGDLINRPADSTIQIVCSNLEQPTIKMGLNGVPCSAGRNILADGNLQLTTLRGESDDIPQLLVPLPGTLRESQPVLQWKAVQHTAVYTISIEAEDKSLSVEQIVPAEQLTFDLVAQNITLAPEKRYRITITADGKRTSVIEPKQQWLRVLSDADIQKLTAQEAQIRWLGVSTLASDILRARLWRSYDLTTDTEKLLQTLVDANPDLTTLLLLAETEAAGLLYDQAATHFNQVVDRATSAQDTEALAIASYQLGQLYLLGRPNPQKAIQYLEQARENYRKLLGEGSQDAIFNRIDKDLELAGHK